MRKTIELQLVVLVFFVLSAVTAAQSLSSIRKIDYQAGHEMIKILNDQVAKNYIDPGFLGVNLPGKFAEADAKIETAKSLGQVYGIVAQPLLSLNDPHTFFVMPPRTGRIDYGWQAQMIGDRAYIIAVAPFSEAEKKGLKVGDELIKWSGFPVTRDTLWKLHYINYLIRPGDTPTLEVKGPDGKTRTVSPPAKALKNHPILKFDATSDGKKDTKNMVNWALDEVRLRKHRFEEIGDLVIWKAPDFDMEQSTVNGFLGSVRKKPMLIIDLRENVGGHEEILETVAGLFVDQDTKICDFQGRKQAEPLMARGRGDSFKGKAVILVDSKTSGAAELLARFLQLNKKATIIGDVTAGNVFRARLHRFDMGESPFAASISEAAPVMSDGICIERVGVTPDQVVLPTPQDLAGGQDPVLSRAAQSLGVDLDPAKAGTLFPVEWVRDLLKE